MSTEAADKTPDNYYRLTEALAKVYDIIREGNLGRPDLVKEVHNYLHSVTNEFKSRHQDVLGNHEPVVVDVMAVVRETISAKKAKEDEDKWAKLIVYDFV